MRGNRNEENIHSNTEVFGFSWGSLISTVAPTIGTIVGQLFSSSHSNNNKLCSTGLVQFDFCQSYEENSEDYKASFVLKDGKYYLVNQSKKQENNVTISFPGIEPKLGPETYVVPGNYMFNVSGLFQENASNDNSRFQLTAGGVDQKANANVNAANGVQFSCSSYRIPVGDQIFHAVGSNVEARITDDKIEVKGKNGQELAAINCIILEGVGDTEYRMSNIPKNMKDEKNVFIVYLPEALKNGDSMKIIVEGVISSSFSSLIDDSRLRKCTTDEIREFSKMQVINK